jgi:hypothetical protein
MFDKMLWSSFRANVTPPTYIKNVEGTCFDCDYSLIDSVDDVVARIPTEVNRLVVKKSIDSSSGKGIAFIHRDSDGVLKDSVTKEQFTEAYLNRSFSKNYVVQKGMLQSAFMSQFCKTSINTIRVAVYRSVKTNKPSVFNAIMRIGKDGSLVDNAHAGGMFVGINDDGLLGQYFCDQYGVKSDTFNGVNLPSQVYQIPNYDRIKKFAEDVANALPHLRLLALDIMLDENNNPILLEYNIRAFGIWVFQFTNGSGFGEFTDEIIEYCRQHKNESTRISVIF